ncbi:MAG: tRNA (adenosine(37)-N6)-dimethylallyltransferase MiaA [Candidatus Kerfeldbacteria bacterium]|nr:tRNA (adenosine(37)-N6)-dimethylallyltransferase MiaA [Candidatus Kerfeldbacteria bacterium]
MSNKVNHQPLVAIVGPTASGKTTLAIKLAKRFKGAAISADSRQLYQHAQVGTSQPVGRWRKANGQWQRTTGQKKIFKVNGVPHFFINELSPNNTYSAAKFQKRTNELIPKLFAIGYLPILVGGTGLYVSAIVQNYNFPSSTTNLKLRAKLEKMTLSELTKKLAKLDRLTYSKIDKSNRRRLVRALEHVLTSGQSFYAAQTRTPRPQTLIIGIKTSPTKLKQAIDRRTRQMIKNGLRRETKYLQRHYPESILFKTIGYQEMAGYLNKNYNLQTTIDLINTHTWQYARRQMTWFKKMPRIVWVKNEQLAIKRVNNFLRQQII